jgi:hypothetical protein
MPIRAHLEGHKFDGETIRLVGIAFEMAVARSVPLPTLTTQFVTYLRSISSRLHKAVSAMPSVSARVPCGRSVLLIHPDRVAARRAAKPPTSDPRCSPNQNGIVAAFHLFGGIRPPAVFS